MEYVLSTDYDMGLKKSVKKFATLLRLYNTYEMKLLILMLKPV